MTEKDFETKRGTIHYWIDMVDENKQTLVFLPGLTADHHLFDKQIEYFEGKYNVFVWDAPGHNASRPFELTFSLADKADYLYEIMQKEKITKPIIIGQSMGGYVGQAFMQNHTGTLKGFISIDSAPLKRKYMTAAEIWLLKRTEPIYRPYPWEPLKRAGSKGCAETEYGRNLMRDMMEKYTKSDYCDLTCHGYRILAEAIEKELPYEIDCPALLMCGEFDKAGSTKRYNKKWTATENLPIIWIKNAGHNSNTDNPQMVNETIEKFVEGLEM